MLDEASGEYGIRRDLRLCIISNDDIKQERSKCKVPQGNKLLRLHIY